VSPIISAQVSDEVAERIEDLREDQDDGKESRSAAIKRVIRAGLEEEERERGVFITLPALISFAGWFLVIAAFFEVEEIVGLAGFVVVGLGVLVDVAERRDWI